MNGPDVPEGYDAPGYEENPADALLAVALAFPDLPKHMLAKLLATPVICKPEVYDEARLQGDRAEIDALHDMEAQGYLLLSDNPANLARELAKIRKAGRRSGNPAKRAFAAKGGKIK